MATCCGILSFTIWELIAICAGVVALATNNWIAPTTSGTACLLGVQSAGLWVVCPGEGEIFTACSSAFTVSNGTGGNATLPAPPAGNGTAGNGTDLGDQFAQIFENIPNEIQSSSSWIFTSDDKCSKLGDQGAVEQYYSSLPIGATDSKDYYLFLQATRGLVVAFTALGFFNIISVAAHAPSRGAAAGCAHLWKSLQVSAGICAIGVFLGMLAGIGSSTQFVWSEFGASVEAGWSSISAMWGWSFWVFVAAVAWALVGWFIMCCAFCCASRAGK